VHDQNRAGNLVVRIPLEAQQESFSLETASDVGSERAGSPSRKAQRVTCETSAKASVGYSRPLSTEAVAVKSRGIPE
jgi:hypothetical protein